MARVVELSWKYLSYRSKMMVAVVDAAADGPFHFKFRLLEEVGC